MKICNMSAEFHGILDYFSIKTMKIRSVSAEFHDLLQQGAMAGPMLETWVYGQLRRSFTNRGIRARLTYYRNNNGAEVDFLLEKDGKIFPMEVKRSSSPRLGDLSGAASQRRAKPLEPINNTPNP